MRTGVAFAQTWRGPYIKQTSTTPMPVGSHCEDPAIYVSPSGMYLGAKYVGSANKIQ